MQELKPCPFCGKHPQEHYEYGSQLHGIKCVDGGKNTQHVLISSYGNTPEEAAISWNTRHEATKEDRYSDRSEIGSDHTNRQPVESCIDEGAFQAARGKHTCTEHPHCEVGDRHFLTAYMNYVGQNSLMRESSQSDECRELFEQWCVRNYMSAYRDHSGNYGQGASICWEAFQAAWNLRPTVRESVAVERIAAIIKNFWDLHSIEPSTGFTPEELAKEICK